MTQFTFTEKSKGKNADVQPNSNKIVKKFTDDGLIWSRIHNWLINSSKNLIIKDLTPNLVV